MCCSKRSWVSLHEWPSPPAPPPCAGEGRRRRRPPGALSSVPPARAHVVGSSTVPAEDVEPGRGDRRGPPPRRSITARAFHLLAQERRSGATRARPPQPSITTHKKPLARARERGWGEGCSCKVATPLHHAKKAPRPRTGEGLGRGLLVQGRPASTERPPRSPTSLQRRPGPEPWTFNEANLIQQIERSRQAAAPASPNRLQAVPYRSRLPLVSLPRPCLPPARPRLPRPPSPRPAATVQDRDAPAHGSAGLDHLSDRRPTACPRPTATAPVGDADTSEPLLPVIPEGGVRRTPSSGRVRHPGARSRTVDQPGISPQASGSA
jgi:hypothetical protein